MKKIFLLILSCIVMFLLGNNVSANDNYYSDSCWYYIEKEETDYINNNPTQEFYIWDNYQSSYITNDYIYLSYIEYNQEPLLMNNNSNSNGVLKRINHKNGNIIKKNLNYINDFNNNIYNILFIEDWFIYYQNEWSIYRISEECWDINLKWKEIYKLELLFFNIYKEKYLFSDGKYIYFEVENNIYRFDYINIWNLELVENIDTSIANNILFNSEILYYLNHIYYNSNWKLYKQYIKNWTILEPEEIYNEELKLFNINEDYIFFLEQDADIEWYITKYIKNDWLDREKKLFYEWYLESWIMLETGFIFYEVIDEWLNDEIHYISFDKPLESTKILDEYYDIYYSDKEKILYNENWYVKTKLLNQKNIPIPTNLRQYIKSPLLEKEEIELWSSIGKFQSGSWIIFETEIDNPESKELKIEIEIYEKISWNTRIFNSEFLNVTWKRSFVIWLDAWDYTWKLRLEDTDWNTSDWVEFKENWLDTDFSIFEWFEPYPYGFSFVNASPDLSKLTWWISWKDWFFKDTREKNPWTKWEIMDMVFPIESFNWDERKYFAAFESLWLNNDNPTIFSDAICFWLWISALTQYHNPEILERNFPVFSNNIWNWYIFDKINIKNDTNNNYQLIWLDDNLKSILALQLYQKETSFSNKRNYSYTNDTPIDVLNKLKTNPWKYILSFRWKTWCNFLWKLCKDVWHTVIPYKVEWNKIYIWDNITPYPFFEDKEWIKEAYNQYIEIDIINNKYSVIWYNRDKFEEIWIVSIDEAFTDNTSVIWFNDIDTLYTLNWNSDILLTDINWNKTWYKNWEIYEEIPWTRIVVNYAWETIDNTFKQIYLPQKLENLTIEINAKVDESYDLMIAWWDYYTKIEWITTASWQTDIFNISRENIKIDFDDNKAENNSYNILVDDFKNNWTWTVMLWNLETINWKQELDINWIEVLNNSNTAVIYSKDLDNDGIQETIENLKAILDYSIEPEPEILSWNISWKIWLYLPQEICKKIWNKNCSQIVKQLEKEILNKTTKLILEKQEELEDEIEWNNKNKNKDKKQNKKLKDKNKEEKQYIELDNKWNYKIVDLEPWIYKLSLELKKWWITKTPQTWYYILEITNWENYIDKDFQVINKLLEQLIKNLKIK